MILVIGPYPSQNNEKDGMIQRVANIDRLLNNHERIYIMSVFSKKTDSFIRKLHYFIKNFFGLTKQIVNKNVRLYNPIEKNQLKKLMNKADWVYIHSLHFACLLDEEWIEQHKNKIIMDIHGCVVEELEYLENLNEHPEILERFKKVESIIFNNIATLISVSGNMTAFYQKKYPQCPGKFIQFPIFNFHNVVHLNKPIHDKPVIIYSGGSQKWQNPELMAKSIIKQKDNFKFLVLTPDVAYFKKILELATDSIYIDIKSVNPNEISSEYQKANFGFVLRDDIIVNNVACPTKLIEYLEHGIIPIVLQPEIGDFNKMGYRYILNDDFLEGRIPNYDTLEKMKIDNYKIIEMLKEEKKASINSLKGLFLCLPK